MRARYVEYKAGKVSEEDMCGEMVTMHKGIAEAAMMQAATDFMAHAFPGTIFAEMRELVDRLRRERLRSLGGFVLERMGHPRRDEAFGIAEDRILAAKVELENGIDHRSSGARSLGARQAESAARSRQERRLTRPLAIRAGTPKCLAMAKHAFAVNPNPDLEATARQRGWTIYFPDGTRE